MIDLCELTVPLRHIFPTELLPTKSQEIHIIKALRDSFDYFHLQSVLI